MSDMKPASKRGLWLIASLGALALGAAVTLFLPSLNREPNTAPRVKSMSNLRQIGQAILLYTQDYEGR
jgi:hypothetical protein